MMLFRPFLPARDLHLFYSSIKSFIVPTTAIPKAVIAAIAATKFIIANSIIAITDFLPHHNHQYLPHHLLVQTKLYPFHLGNLE